MARPTRSFSLAVLAAAALFAAGCGKSNNEGKIVGKWRLGELPAGVPGAAEMKQAEAMGMYLYFDFRDDKTFEMGVGANNPGMEQLLKAQGASVSMVGKYKLLSGDGVEFHDLPKEMQEKGGMFGRNKDRARTNVTINGDTMTWTDADGKSMNLTRVGSAPAAPAKAPSDTQ